MPVNDFEKQVQQKMDELQLRPSTTVWEEVEKRIRKEKKRRRFIFCFFLFGVLLLGGTGWWLVNENKKQSSENTRVAQSGSDKKNDTQTFNSNTENKTSSIELNQQNYKQSEEDSIAQSTEDVVAPKKIIIADKTTTLTTAIKKTKKQKRKVNIATASIKKKIPEPVLATTDNPVVTVQQEVIDNNNKKNVVVEASSTKKDSIISDKVITSASTDIVESKIPSTKPSDTLIAKVDEPVAKKDSSKSKKNKWEIGVTGFAGSSNKSEGVSIGAQKRMDASFMQSSNPGGPAAPVMSAPYVTKGFAWQLGIYAKRKIKERTGLSVGLNFSAYSTKQQTGAYVDSSGVFTTRYYSTSFTNVYRSGAARTYNNHYYYLQVPVLFHWQLNKGKKLSLIFQNGFTVGLLTGTNGLAYRSSSNLFYQDKKSYNKIQLSYQTGLYAKFFNSAKHPVTAGFMYNYHLSNLQRVNNYGGNHLSSFGVQLGWLLKK